MASGAAGVPRVLAAALFLKRAVCSECLASTQHFSPYLFCVEDAVAVAAAAERGRQAGEEERKTASLILSKYNTSVAFQIKTSTNGRAKKIKIKPQKKLNDDMFDSDNVSNKHVCG